MSDMETRIFIVVVVHSLSRVQLFVTPWTAACKASLSFTIFQSLLKLMSSESVMPSNHLLLCRPLLLLPSVFPSIRVFSNESALHIRWPKYWSFSFSIIPSKEIPGLISLRMDWLDLLTQSLIKWAEIQVKNPPYVQKLSFPHLLGHPVYLWSLNYSNPEVLENGSYLKIVAHELST